MKNYCLSSGKDTSNIQIAMNYKYKLLWTIYKTILSYCFKCWKNIESKNLMVVKAKKWKIVLLSTCTACEW